MLMPYDPKAERRIELASIRNTRNIRILQNIGRVEIGCVDLIQQSTFRRIRIVSDSSRNFDRVASMLTNFSQSQVLKRLKKRQSLTTKLWQARLRKAVLNLETPSI